MYDRYTIKRGDNLYDIARNYNTTVDYLLDINNMNYNNDFRYGREIIVPKGKESYFNTYVIEKGDSLYAIARKYNINPELLAALNGIKIDDYIYPNETILIPKNGYSYYITKEGDTLSLVSQRFNITTEKLIKENPTIYLMEGQLLVKKN